MSGAVAAVIAIKDGLGRFFGDWDARGANTAITKPTGPAAIVVRDMLTTFFGRRWDARDADTVIAKLTDPRDMSMDDIIDRGVIKDGRPRYYRQAPIQGIYTTGDGEAAVDKLLIDPIKNMDDRPTRGWLKFVLTRLFTRTHYKPSVYDGIYIEYRDTPIIYLKNAYPDGRSVLSLDLGPIADRMGLLMPVMLDEAQRERETNRARGNPPPDTE